MHGILLFLVYSLTLSQIFCERYPVKCNRCQNVRNLPYNRWFKRQCTSKTLSIEHSQCSRAEIKRGNGKCRCKDGHCSVTINGKDVCCNKTPHEVCTVNDWKARECGANSCNEGYEGRMLSGKCVCCQQYHVYGCCPSGSGCVKKSFKIANKDTCTSDELQIDCPNALCTSDYACRRKSEISEPICCKNAAQIDDKPDTSVVPFEELPICILDGQISHKKCNFDVDCGHCMYQCTVVGQGVGVCCRRSRKPKLINGTSIVAISACGPDGACGGGNVCHDGLCFEKAEIEGDWQAKPCPNSKLSSVFCEAQCCPKGMRCSGGICCGV